MKVRSEVLHYRLGLPSVRDSREERIPSQREGFILHLSSSSGAEGWGEAAPLPGRSTESLSDVHDALGNVDRWLEDIDDPPPVPGWSHDVLDSLSAVSMSASVRFAVESAVLDLLSRERGVVWSRDYARDYLRVLPMCALLPGAGKDVMALFRTRMESGFNVFKIKVGDGRLEDDVACIRAMASLGGGGVVLRVDANRAWTLDDALAFADGVRQCGVAYIEEPVKLSADLTAFAAASPVPLALDESLDGERNAVFSLRLAAAAYIIKPTLHGGISGALALCERACRRGAVPVLSAAFESGIGIRSLVQIGAVMNFSPVAVGLDTWRWLRGDVLRQAPSFTKPRLDVHRIAEATVRLNRRASIDVATR